MAKYKLGLKPKTRKRISTMLSFLISATLLYFVWLTWKNLTDWIGSSMVVWFITGGVVLLGIFLGFISIDKIIKKFS